MELQQLLKTQKCFKLVCAAANENEEEVEKLVAIYSKAGCHFFDLCAKKEVIDAAQKGLLYSVSKEKIYDYHLCISIGIKNNQHITKALINENKCSKCNLCFEVCEQNAIKNDNDKYSIIKPNCIGCKKCHKVCKSDAILFYSEDKDFKKLLSELTQHTLSCVEFHISGENEEEIDKKWSEINDSFSGILSICINRSECGDKKTIERIKRLISIRQPFSTIIQTDGKPMSGSCNDFKTTLQTIAFAEILNNENLPVFLMLSGGTNARTAELANLCNIKVDGIAVGSYARKIIRPYLNMPDLLHNKKAFEEAVTIAKYLVDTVSKLN